MLKNEDQRCNFLTAKVVFIKPMSYTAARSIENICKKSFFQTKTQYITTSRSAPKAT